MLIKVQPTYASKNLNCALKLLIKGVTFTSSYYTLVATLVDKVHEKSRFIHNLYTKIAIYAKSVHKNRDLYTSQKKIHKNRDFCSRINRDFRVTYMLNYLIHKNRDFCSCINRDFCDKYMLNHLIHKNRDFCSRINRDFCDIYMLNH